MASPPPQQQQAPPSPPTNPNPSSSSEPLLSELCPYCNINPPKYRCPACGARSCSLPCSKRHKVFNQCTGIRDPTTYVRRTDLNSLAALDRDYNYLAGVEKTLTRPPVINFGSDGDDLAEDGEEKTGEDEMSRRERLATYLEYRGILVRQAPMGMKRARENKTSLVGAKKKRKTCRWTVEWIMVEKGQEKRILVDKIPESMRLAEAYTEQLAQQLNLQNKNDRRRKVEASRFFLKKADTPANQPTLIEIPCDKSLMDVLQGHVVLEYPTIFVCDELPQNFTVIEMEPREVKQDNVTDKEEIVTGQPDRSATATTTNNNELDETSGNLGGGVELGTSTETNTIAPENTTRTETGEIMLENTSPESDTIILKNTGTELEIAALESTETDAVILENTSTETYTVALEDASTEMNKSTETDTVALKNTSTAKASVPAENTIENTITHGEDQTGL
ncbi:hypothetical protein DFH27DRAFT_354248 [Peziza echinospora]|nr:hypothetical protein DFH27DRAFT_354248 [Peziza echinospora]